MPSPIPVELHSHDPTWAECASAEATRWKDAIGPSLVVVHHIGSTAIPGIVAKPIIDLMPIFTDLAAADTARPIIEQLGYAWWGEYGLTDRRYCTFSDENTGRRRMQAHCYAADSPAIERHLAFRDYLRSNPALARTYAEEKQRCCNLHPLDSHAYTDCKSDWIRRTEVEAVKWYTARQTPVERSPSSNAAWVAPGVLQGRLIRLEPLDIRHAASMFQAADPSVFRFMRNVPEWTIAGFTRYIEQMVAQPNSYSFAIVHNETDQVVGRIRYSEIALIDRRLRIGTWIGPQYQGTGVNPEAKYLLMHYAFERLSPAAVRVEFPVNAENQQSMRAMEKLGAVLEGIFRKGRIAPVSMEPNAPLIATNMLMYSIIDDDWPAVRIRLEDRLGWSA